MEEKKNLKLLLSQLKPVLKDEVYVFCTTKDNSKVDFTKALAIIQEEEGTTLIIPKDEAIKLKLPFEFECHQITCKVHSSLEAIGLTAAFSKALAAKGISCNVVAGYYHDHIFVPISKAKKAIEVLSNLSANLNEIH